MKFSVGDKVKFKSDVTGEFIDATVIDIIDDRYFVDTIYGATILTQIEMLNHQKFGGLQLDCFVS